ncbi:hypothetical protein O0L34_g8852 [Tuta absoluta]|nr:hypothetical protein O0L34_g8852 [Tuta absoluta]
MNLNAIFGGFFLILTAYRLRARAAAPASSAPSASLSLGSSPAWGGGAGAGAGAAFDLLAEPRPAPHDSMELRRHLSVSVVEALPLRSHATTYRRSRTDTSTHSAPHSHHAHCSLTC